jgi:hypothetical protein
MMEVRKAYVNAPEVAPLARRVIKKFGLADAGLARIKYMFKFTSRPNSEWGYITRAVGHWKHLTDIDFVVTLWGDWWAAAPDDAREANLLHQLLHIRINPKTGAWELRKHPISCFPEEIAYFGAWNNTLKELLKLVESVRK